MHDFGLTGVQLGDFVGIAAGSKMYSFVHHYRSKRSPSRIMMHDSRVPNGLRVLIAGPIHVEANVFLACNVIVLPGVTIARDVFDAIWTLVDKDVGRGLLVAGNPTEIIGERFARAEG